MDGGYGPWTRYKQCSVTCGLGFQVRTRECNNPKPAHGGKRCKRLGTSFEMKYCRMPRCPGKCWLELSLRESTESQDEVWCRERLIRGCKGCLEAKALQNTHF